MKIVIYDEETRDVLEVIEGAEDVIKTDGGVKWNTGELVDLKKPYMLLPDDADIGDTVADGFVPSPNVSMSVSIEDKLKAENRALSNRVDFLEEVLTEMIFSIYE